MGEHKFKTRLWYNLAVISRLYLKKLKRAGDVVQSSMEAMCWVWWLMPLILALRRLKRKDRCEFKASLNYIVTPCLLKKKKKERNREKVTVGACCSCNVLASLAGVAESELMWQPFLQMIPRISSIYPVKLSFLFSVLFFPFLFSLPSFLILFFSETGTGLLAQTDISPYYCVLPSLKTPPLRRVPKPGTGQGFSSAAQSTCLINVRSSVRSPVPKKRKKNSGVQLR